MGHKSISVNLSKLELYKPFFFWPQHYETRYKLRGEKKENCKAHKHIEAKQHTLNNQQVTEDSKKEIKKYLETNDNENVTIQNLCD